MASEYEHAMAMLAAKRQTIAEIQAKNAAMRDALKPFAKVMDWLEERGLEGKIMDLSDHIWVFRIDAGDDSLAMTVGKFRAARDALRKREGL